jgi:Glycosyl hydrolase catalytic core
MSVRVGIGDRPLGLLVAWASMLAACSGAVSGGGPGSAGTGQGGASSGGVTPSGSASGAGGNAGGAGGSPAPTTGGAGGSAGATPTGGAPGSGGAGASVDAGGRGTGGAGTGPDGGTGAQAAFKGVALLEPAGCPDLATLGLSWYYNWTTKTGCRGATAQFITQIWGHPTEAIATEIATIVGAGQTTVLGFNEPDNTGQSNMPVATAISRWPQLQQPGLRLGSPATSANAAGQTWFQQFMTQVAQNNLRVDFIAIHWYGWNAGSCDNANALEAYIKWAEQWKLPIWITEWGCLNVSAPTEQTVKGFYDAAVVMFQKHPLIERYGWFLSRATDNNALVNSSTVSLTPLGMDYAAAAATR